MAPMAQWVGQQGFEAVGTGSNPSFYLPFFSISITTENGDPPLMHQKLRYQNFSENRKGSPTKFFGTMRQNTFDGKS